MREDEPTERAPITRADLLHRIALVIDAECGGSACVLASRAGLRLEVATRLQAGDVQALTVEALLAVLHTFPTHAHWLVSGENARR